MPTCKPINPATAAAQGSLPLWVESLRQATVWKRGLMLGLPVGLLQAVINQGDLWWRHDVDGAVIAKTIISPMVTFAVALVSAAATWIERQRSTMSAKQIRQRIAETEFETKHYDRIEI